MLKPGLSNYCLFFISRLYIAQVCKNSGIDQVTVVCESIYKRSIYFNIPSKWISGLQIFELVEN